ncbi:MAG: sugar ABC transporter ATP-binding protein, partial [Verrucomicrobiae bacterium]|nr:sugar ABC transporter ATP-binding protein [Verrucomicrobiae bacterium]
DEPTSSLSQKETENLFTVIRDLRQRGVSIIYISHRLGEVKELADRVTVLRDGENAGDLAREEISHDRMVSLMVGRDLSQFYPHQPHAPGEVALEVRDFRTPAHPRHALNFSIRAGEIVGVAGLVGAGRTELIETIFGVYPPAGGECRVGGQVTAIRSPRDAIRAGLALAPEDRKQQGLILDMAVRENLSLASLKRDEKRGFLNLRKEREIAAEMIGKMRIKTPSDRQVVRYLSGGNQQKVVLGKWLAMKPRVLLLDEPTRGIDVGAKQEIYALMEELAREGVAILFVSSELEEILGMSDRTLVMHEGRLTGELSREQLGEEAVMRLATGGLAEASAAA